MKIEYKVSDTKECLTPCPYELKNSFLNMVGSYNCRNCINNRKTDVDNLFIECAYRDTRKKIYLASALFTLAEQDYNRKLNYELISKGHSVFLPQLECEGLTNPKKISEKCKQGILSADMLVVNMEGTDVDSGTAWECGFATALNKPIIGVRTDFRQRGDDGGLNCMLSQNTVAIITDSNFDNIIKEIDEVIRGI